MAMLEELNNAPELPALKPGAVRAIVDDASMSTSLHLASDGGPAFAPPDSHYFTPAGPAVGCSCLYNNTLVPCAICIALLLQWETQVPPGRKLCRASILIAASSAADSAVWYHTASGKGQQFVPALLVSCSCCYHR